MSNIMIQERETGNRTLISTLSPTAQSDATDYVCVWLTMWSMWMK